MATARATPETTEVLDDATDVVLMMSRLLVGVAAQSLAATEDRITLVQYRALVILSATGPQNVSALADALGIHASTATRLCDRLIANGFIDRSTAKHNRREVMLALSEKGRALVRAETARRRRAIRAMVGRLEGETQRQLVDVFSALATAAEAGPDHAWKLGWTS
jgi:DNA-binding MarR family transcriptional regulator